MKPARQYLTPRAIAWALLLIGIAWFVHVSPKTPLEFFDCAVRDDESIDGLRLAKCESIEPAAAASMRRVAAIMSCGRRIDRIALLYDLRSNPRKVHAQRGSIVDGCYQADGETDKILKAHNPEYCALLREIADRRKEHIQSPRPSSALLPESREDRYFSQVVGEMEIERSLLRSFQLRVFWWR